MKEEEKKDGTPGEAGEEVVGDEVIFHDRRLGWRSRDEVGLDVSERKARETKKETTE